MHFINFQLPILFFLIVDLASFFIPDRGEKLCFKVTVLLGISVLMLILNDILPSKSHRCPLIGKGILGSRKFPLIQISLFISEVCLDIWLSPLFSAATYVIVIFSFMLLSLLETILVIYLINMSSEQDTKRVQRPEDLSSETGMHIFHSKTETVLSYCNRTVFFFQINPKETAVIPSVILEWRLL